jgi:hypothetical protein
VTCESCKAFFRRNALKDQVWNVESCLGHFLCFKIKSLRGASESCDFNQIVLNHSQVGMGLDMISYFSRVMTLNWLM